MLCGDKNLSNVIMATNQWERVLEEDGIERERQLRETPHFWGYMVDRGSQMHRHYNTRESALRLIDSLVGGTAPRSKIVLDIQTQMVDEGKDLASTGAGQAVDDAISQITQNFFTLPENIVDIALGVTEGGNKLDPSSVDQFRK